MNFYISDLHVFCKSQTKQGANYDNRPFETVEEMNQYILQHWNSRVTNADKVYILGDIALKGRSNALIGLVAQLKGRKILVIGNHDDVSDYRYQQLFEKIVPYAEVEDAFWGKNYKLVLQHYLFSVRLLFKKIKALLSQTLLRYEQLKVFTADDFVPCSMR